MSKPIVQQVRIGDEDYLAIIQPQRGGGMDYRTKIPNPKMYMVGQTIQGPTWEVDGTTMDGIQANALIAIAERLEKLVEVLERSHPEPQTTDIYPTRFTYGTRELTQAELEAIRKGTYPDEWHGTIG